MSNKYRVGILGATGTVGQRFVQLLEDHPQFEVTELAASDRSEGKPYSLACNWRLPRPMPESVRDMIVRPITPLIDCDIVFSSLPSGIARDTEIEFAESGHVVVSNSSAMRMGEDIPLIVPEINPEHLSLIKTQQVKRRFSHGFIVTNPNCAVITFAAPLAALNEEFGVDSASVTTMQSISGAGYPGVASMDMADNVVPYIAGEEPKVESESQKILGRVYGEKIVSAGFALSAQCNRVPMLEGHIACVKVKLKKQVPIEKVRRAFEEFPCLDLHSAPVNPIIVRDEADRPQPRLDRDAGAGMSITVGRLQADNVFDYRFVALSHNTIRGAAGAAILNAELLVSRQMV